MAAPPTQRTLSGDDPSASPEIPLTVKQPAPAMPLTVKQSSAQSEVLLGREWIHLDETDVQATLVPPENVLPPQKIGPYEILKELGRGGMGVVFLARDGRLNRFVALKMVVAGLFTDAERVARFKAEAQAIALLRHENIV